MKIGILETGSTPDELVEKYGNYSQMFIDFFEQTNKGFEFQIFDIRNDHFPIDHSQCDCWLITGSAHGAYEELPWMLKLEKFIQDIHAHKIPMIGICFGHQIIAKALGGTVVKSEKGWGVGLQHYQITKDFPFDHQDDVLTIAAIHQDQVIEKPHEAKTIVSSNFCPFAGLSYGNHIITLQPHPEFTIDFEYDLVDIRRNIIPEPTVTTALNEMKTNNAKLHSHKVADWFAEFLLAQK